MQGASLSQQARAEVFRQLLAFSVSPLARDRSQLFPPEHFKYASNVVPAKSK